MAINIGMNQMTIVFDWLEKLGQPIDTPIDVG